MKVLGLSFYYHDSAAVLVVDGVPVAMAEEERFSRRKHDSGFPSNAVNFVLTQGGLTISNIDHVVFYEKPLIKFDRIMRTVLGTFPFAPGVFIEGIRTLMSDKLWVRALIASKLRIPHTKILFSGHHFSHAASTFFASPFDHATILTVDGVGEWATLTIAEGKGDTITPLREIQFPHSLGLLYSAFTAFLGFEVNEGEYKVMGMAPYGKPRYADKVRKLVIIYEDGSFSLDLSYFTFHRSTRRMYSSKFIELFGSPRTPESKFFTRSTGWPSYFGQKPPAAEYTKRAEEQEHYADIAASVQLVLEEVLIHLAYIAHDLVPSRNLCLAGGVALNSVANWRILTEGPFDELFIQPAAGDAGGALGAALGAARILGGGKKFELTHPYYGASFSDAAIAQVLKESGVKSRVLSDTTLAETVADLLSSGKVVGWFQGRFEWGPRALGARSIIADPRRAEMKEIVNTKIKFREPYRPFAPSILAEHAHEYFALEKGKRYEPARFMLYVVPVRKEAQGKVPAITHVDGSARPQLVDQRSEPRYRALIEAFYKKTGIPLILNTSFNLRGEPIVTTPLDALKTFKKSEMDILVLGSCVVTRADVASLPL